MNQRQRPILYRLYCHCKEKKALRFYSDFLILKKWIFNTLISTNFISNNCLCKVAYNKAALKNIQKIGFSIRVQSELMIGKDFPIITPIIYFQLQGVEVNW